VEGIVKIVRVTRKQIHEVYNKLLAQNRRMIPELMVTNLYIQMENVLLVASDDVEFRNFPPDQEISIEKDFRSTSPPSSETKF
jgi:hypothetical protein